MEAHNALSARIAERAGFRALWASGLTISSTLGYRDCSEATFTEVADVLHRIVDTVDVPVLVDGDTGWGNFNNARLAAKRLSGMGAAGMCLEDKLFPKLNSFLGSAQPLADIDEFCGKIRACVDATAARDFVVIARVEALVSDLPMEEALLRAERYVEAGAGAVLIHSKRRDADEILKFAGLWRGAAPLIIVPTTYADTPARLFEEAGISVVIWANHSLRASIRAMTDVCAAIQETRSPAGAASSLADLSEVFDLFDYDELERSEGVYLPSR